MRPLQTQGSEAGLTGEGPFPRPATGAEQHTRSAHDRPLVAWDRDRAARVLVITSFRVPHAGGASTHIENLVSVLKARGLFEGMVAGQGPLASAPRRLRFFPLRLVDSDAARARTLDAIVAAQSREIAKRARRVQDLVLHAHDPVATCAALRSKIPGCVVVQTVHGPFSREYVMVGHDPRGAFIQRARALESEAFSGADLLLPVDHEQARILRDDYGVGDRRIQVIANAVDVEKLARLSEAPIERDAAEEPYFLVPRRLVAKNGVEFAIRALAHLGRPSVRLLIAGGGPLERSLRKLARQLGSADQVQFLGVVAREELFDLYHSAAAVIVPSIPAFGVVEATSFVVLEAMAVGVPVIASGIGGIHEIVVDWSQGFLVPPGDDAALTAAMRSTLEMNATARASLVSAARARVNDSFNLETWACKVLDAYRQALGGS